MASQQTEAPCCGQRVFSSIQELSKSRTSTETPSPAPKLPLTSPERLANASSEKTILYLAYGSNLSAETFKGVRGIKPLSAINAHIPSLNLTFDLPGIPYLEPCFANTAYRTPETQSSSPTKTDYHKDRWHKGLIGVVYEVTPEDYRTIIATEGGGASYKDILVDCYALPSGLKTVNPTPQGTPFTAHTLLDSGSRLSRPDPSYAQASARYLKLLTDGGEEHSLPEEYMAYLYNLRSYEITTRRQKMGRALFLGIWAPFILALSTFGKTLADDEGKIPGWFAKVMELVFRCMWGSYDVGFKKVFGDGERTIGDTGDEEEVGRKWWCEKGERGVMI